MPNNYVDTRGVCKMPVAFTEAVVNGLANGGGLYVPEHIPHMNLDEIIELGNLSYAERAAKVYKLFEIDMPDELIDGLMKSAYGAQFDSNEICPIETLDEDTHILELWHGPTSAFKDMALQCLPRFFSASVKLLQERGKLDRDFMILVATSGDTGKAALEGFRDVPGVSIGVMYPHGGVSDIQYKQMATQRGENVCVWAVEGNFDDCQNAAKAVFSDEAFAKKLLEEQHTALSSANSINWGRLLPQVVYYISAYAMLVKQGKIEAGEEIDVCVPTGNFGNILAAWYAKQIGTPIHTLICASNKNRVLTDFIETGTYDIKDREFVLTPSPSMDILISSNLERQLFELSNRNSESIEKWMKELKNERRFSVDADTLARVQETFAAGSTDNDVCLSTIKEVFDEYHYLLDPHTAVAYNVAKRNKSVRKQLIASTAHWAKFGENVYRALHEMHAGENLPEDIASIDGCSLNKIIESETKASAIPLGLAELESLPIRFNEVIESEPAVVENATLEFLEKLKK
jgi:threonine synthase